ncbi:hypothetical protein [Citrobacter sp. Igbk 16]|uniref:hypothetical protein n=1 Tax=Citrobacter sp. Igbk 16 TaxID=2963958 RepID=UPI0023043093|nr:hypothetical protein [Citrobacter sp. Igbk 16]MDA8518963.1 hypothetical protein [Citrobacter sp. Igbk 16]
MNHQARFAIKMLHKRGLSPQELDDLDPDIFNALYIYDQVIEPNGARHDMLAHAQLCHTILLSSQSITKEGRKNLQLSDFDYIGILGDDSLTVKEKNVKREKAKHENSKNNIASLGSMIKKMAKENANGKK